MSARSRNTENLIGRQWGETAQANIGKKPTIAHRQFSRLIRLHSRFKHLLLSRHKLAVTYYLDVSRLNAVAILIEVG